MIAKQAATVPIKFLHIHHSHVRGDPLNRGGEHMQSCHHQELIGNPVFGYDNLIIAGIIHHYGVAYPSSRGH